MEQTILVVDSDRAVAQMLASRLGRVGLRVIVAFDAVQAMMAVRKSQPDAILLDVPVLSGAAIETLKKLKLSAKVCQIPVIAMSASVDPLVAQTVKELGAEEFLQKPFDVEALDRALYQLLAKPLAPVLIAGLRRA